MDIKHVEAVAEQLVADVVDTVRKDPRYADLVNRLTEAAITAIAASV